MNLTIDNLKAYSSAAIQNGALLVREASLLCSHQHYARGYFLAVAGIEEIGKAVIAFNAQGRNLRDPAVTSKVSSLLGDHAAKIRSAFIGFLIADPRKNAETAVELMIDLQRGREPSMYTDQAADGSVQVPTDVVRRSAAEDCVRLAGDCLASAKHHIASTTPPRTSRVEDQLFALRSSQLTELMNTSDFWWYYISRMEAGESDYAAAVMHYRSEYALAGKTFQSAASGNAA